MSVVDPNHLCQALRWSLQGLGHAFKTQVAFRMDTVGVIAVVIALCVIRPGVFWFTVLVGAALLVPLVELLNSAVEEICDLITKERNDHIKHAKDMGSAAVFLAVLINGALWMGMLWERFA